MPILATYNILVQVQLVPNSLYRLHVVVFVSFTFKFLSNRLYRGIVFKMRDLLVLK